MHEVVASSVVMLNETLEDADVDMDEVEEPEGYLSASVLAMVYKAPESTTMEVNLRLFVGESLVENLQFHRAEICTVMEHIRLRDEIKVNRSRYTKLEGLLCSWWRCATAAQGNQTEPLFGLDRHRLSEHRIHVHQPLIGDHRAQGPAHPGAMAGLDGWNSWWTVVRMRQVRTILNLRANFILQIIIAQIVRTLR